MSKYKGDVAFKVFAAVFLTAGTVFLLIPIVAMFGRSLDIKGIQNYVTVFQEITIGKSLVNSIIVVGATIFITMMICSLAAYAFSKLQFAGKTVLFVIILMGIMIPASATLFPVFQITKLVGLRNRLAGLVGPYVTGNAIFGLLLLKIFYDDLPNELMEAARIDGASPFQIFAKIYFPISKPGLSILLINTFNGSWNELMTCITLIDDKSKYTMAVLPYKYKLEVMGQFVNSTKWPQIFACMILCMIPVVIFYCFAQKMIFGGVAAGAVKG